MKLLKKIGKYLAIIVVTILVTAGGMGIYKDYKAREEVVKRGAVPLVAKIRSSIIGRGYVVKLRSQLKHDLFIDVLFQNKDQTDKKLFKVHLEQDRPTIIGWAEGWKVNKTDLMTVSATGYLDKTYSFNKN